MSGKVVKFDSNYKNREKKILKKETEEILKTLENEYGFNKCKETARNYATYIELKKKEKINWGTYNLFIKNNSDYVSSKKLVDAVEKILKAEKIIKTCGKYVDRDDIKIEKTGNRRDKKEKKEIKEDLIIIDSDVIDSDLIHYKKEIMDFMIKFPEKIYILVDNDNYRFKRDGEINAYFSDYITWYMEIEEISKENNEDYIKKILEENAVDLEPENTFVEALSEESFWRVRDELTNIILECKAKNIKKINDEIIKNKLKRKYYKDVKKNDKTKGLEDLDSMIGMKEVKEQIEKIINFVKVSKDRKKLPMLHMCFLGNPGTGKTTVARVVGKIFAEEKIFSEKEKFVEVHGRDLIAKYVGWTAQTTKDKVKQAEDGVLFIDEAYSLQPRDHRGFEEEAIATLIKEMEDKRDNLCVIMAGYTNEMDELLQANPGFNSRIQFKIDFPDYTEEELYEIFKQLAKKEKYKISPNIKQTVLEYFKNEKKKENFGNAREVRNLFEKVKFEQASRICKNKEENINTIKNVVQKTEKPKQEKIKIGF